MTATVMVVDDDDNGNGGDVADGGRIERKRIGAIQYQKKIKMMDFVFQQKKKKVTRVCLFGHKNFIAVRLSLLTKSEEP